MLVALAAGCSDTPAEDPGGGTSSTAPEATSTRPAITSSTAPTRVDPLRAVMEPDTVAGLALGATRDDVRARLGSPTEVVQRRDSSGTYEAWFYQFTVPETANAGLYLGFRTGSRCSPNLTDWITNAAGPTTAAGVQLRDPESKVQASYPGAAQAVEGGRAYALKGRDGELRVLVADVSGAVVTVAGGDRTAWRRSFRD